MSCHNISESEFDQWLGETLGQELDLDPRIVAKARSISLRKPQGASLMKKTLWTTAAALVAAAAIVTVLVPRAEASSPKTKFAAMKKALLAKQQQANITFDFLASSKEIKSIAFVDGRIVEAKGSIEFTNDNPKIITDPEHADLSHLSAEERAEIEKIIQQIKAGGDASGTEFWVDGKKVSAEEAERLLKEHGVGLNMTTGPNGEVMFEFNFNLDESSYSAMSFGSDENTLLLTPKKNKDTRYSVRLNPKTNLPYKVTLQSSKAGKWKDVRDSQVRYKVKLKKS